MPEACKTLVNCSKKRSRSSFPVNSGSVRFGKRRPEDEAEWPTKSVKSLTAAARDAISSPRALLAATCSLIT